jgi:hypothetical protein
MVDLPLRDRSGNALVSFDSTDGAELGHPDAAPMPASLVVVVCAAVFRLVLPAVPQLAGDDEILDFR